MPYIGAVTIGDESKRCGAPEPRHCTSEATKRNRDPILAVLRRLFPPRGTVIEAASGTGEHAVHFAAALPELTWQPSDIDPASLDSIAAWRRTSRLSNVLAPLTLDLGSVPTEPADGTRYVAGFCANLVHIAPWPVCTHLMAFMGAHLDVQAPFVMYGPYKVNGQHTSESNVAFESWLHAQSPSYGVRDMAAVIEQAERFGLGHTETIPMPSNNFCLVFRKYA